MVAPAGSSFVVRECRGMRWTVRTDCAERFLREIAPRYSSIESEPGVQMIKSSLRRMICRIGPPLAPEGNLVLKRQRFSQLRYWLKYLARPSKAAHEWHMAWRLAREGIASFQPVALGERRRWGTVTECCLLSEEIVGAQKLSQFVRSLASRLPPAQRRELVRRLLRELAALLARVHRAGLHHPDLHDSNVLVRAEHDGHFKLFVIDLHAVWRLPLLTRWHECRSLAVLARSLPGVMSRANLARLLASYAQQTGRPPEFWRRLLRPVERQMLRRRFELHEARDLRCLRASTNFAVRRTTDWRLVYRRPLENHPLVQDPDSGAAGEERFELTRYERAKDARAAWSALHGLRIRHVGAPRPHVLVESRPTDRKSCVLTEKLPQARSLREWLRELPRVARGAEFRTKTALLRAVADRFHVACRNGVRHRACTAENVLAAPEPGGWRVVFAQSPHVRFGRRLSDAQKIQMLAQFAWSIGEFSRAAAWRFYRGCFGGSPAWLRHDVARRVWRQVRQRLGRGRPS